MKRNQLFHLLSSGLIVYGLSACTKYQFATVDGNLQRNNRNEFVSETDSFRVEYNFNGHSGPVKISIHNKLDIPLYVNWKKSAIVIDGKSSTYWKDQAILDGSTSSVGIESANTVSTSSGSISGTITKSDEISFIAPKSYADVSMIRLKSDMFKFNKSLKPISATYSALSGPESDPTYFFDDEDSPMHYSSYITLSYDPNFEHEAIIKNEFWVREVMETYTKPKSIPMKGKAPDSFYNSKATGFGTFMGIIGLGALVVLGASTAN